MQFETWAVPSPERKTRSSASAPIKEATEQGSRDPASLHSHHVTTKEESLQLHGRQGRTQIRKVLNAKFPLDMPS